MSSVPTHVDFSSDDNGRRLLSRLTERIFELAFLLNTKKQDCISSFTPKTEYVALDAATPLMK